MKNSLVGALRSAGVTTITPLDAGTIGHTDEQQLVFAAHAGYVLFTHNISDFQRLHTQWVNAGRNHRGIILVQQGRFSVGEQVRRLLRLLSSLSAEDMQDRIEFLANWG